VSVAASPIDAVDDGLLREDAIRSRASTENFSVASLLLGPRARRHLFAVYGFARLVDQMGDEASQNRLALLDLLEQDLERAFTGEPEHAVLRTLAPTIRACALPREPFLRLIEANRQDQRVARYETFAQLADYCDLSANPVGELVLHVFGVATPERVALSDRVCTALQLVEHWQDVGEDFRRGRVYLPTEDLERFGVALDELEAVSASEALRALIAFEVERARALLDEGARLVRTLRGRARLAVAGYVAGGRANLDAIAAAGFDVLSATPRAGRLQRVAATLRSL
jgi:squalene synthase HpnC